MIKVSQMQDLIQLILEKMDLYSKDAEYLLVGTSAQESRLGTYLKQYPTGPAQGIFQMEPATEKDIWDNYLKYKSKIADKIPKICGFDPFGRHALQWDLAYQVIMARLHYYRRPEPLPAHTDVPGMAAYWKQHYNTPLGKGKVEEFVNNFPNELKS